MKKAFCSLVLMGMLALFVLAACSGENGANGSNGLNTLVSIVSEPAGTHCAYGGISVNSGVDTNGNGVLDPSEVTSTQYACNGVNGSNGYTDLVAIVSEPAGTNCANGGKKVSVGLDTNANDVLDASEITSSNYICNGAIGSNGLNSLMAIVSEPSGSICSNGGLKITSGLDANSNGTLDASEVTSMKYVCNGAGISWVDVTGTSVQAASNTGYLADSASQVAITLPPSPALGDIVQVTGVGTGGWVVAQNAGQSVISKNLVDPSFGAVWTGHLTGLAWLSVASSADGSKLVAVPLSDQIYTSDDSGATWTPRDSARSWTSVASSSDGTKLVAVAAGDQIFTSIDSGATWTPQGPTLNWIGVASSSDGTKLVAVPNGDQIYTSIDSGATWTARDSSRTWLGVASSADGTKLVATENGGRIYTSIDSGVTWTPRESARNWRGVASSSDGTKLVAAVSFGGRIYTSIDSGVTWTPRDSPRNWWGVASSSDGNRLVATENGGRLYTSIDSGANWIARGPATSWFAAASSSDGSRLVAVEEGGLVYTSEPTALQSTTVGTTGAIGGEQYDAIELQYVGNNTFTILSSEGQLAAQ